MTNDELRMTNLKYILIAFFSLFLVQDVSAQNEFPAKPNPPRLVNDFTGMLSADERARLESKLVAFDDSTSTQIAVVIVQTIHGYDINDYGARLGEQWGVGRKGKDNGVLLLVAKEEREAAISTGYGIEGVLTDALSRRIIDNYLVPNFKQGNYYKGLDESTNVIIKLTTGEFKADDVTRKPKNTFTTLLICLVIIFIVVNAIRNRNNHHTYTGRGHSRGWGGPWIGGGMGGFGGGWGGGGSSGGGGFGGFGGGGFGGGGASGKW